MLAIVEVILNGGGGKCTKGGGHQFMGDLLGERGLPCPHARHDSLCCAGHLSHDGEEGARRGGEEETEDARKVGEARRLGGQEVRRAGREDVRT